MAPPNLTRTDAARRAALLEVADYVVELDLTDGGGKPGDATFASTTTVRFRCTEPGADSWIDLVAAEVAAATLNGAAAGRRPATARRTASRCPRWPRTTSCGSRPPAGT